MARRREIVDDAPVAATKSGAPRVPTGPKQRGPKRESAQRDAFYREVRSFARVELRSFYPNLTEETFDRFETLYGPAAPVAPEAHAHLRKIREAIGNANAHLSKLHLGALDEPDHQLFEVLRALNMWPLPSALDHAERAVGFRTHDLPELHNRGSLVEEMLGTLGLQCPPRHFALMSLAVGFGPTMNVEWRTATVEWIVGRETKTMISELNRLKAAGQPIVRAQIKKVVFAGKRGRPKKRN
jgi:hypothetical protein